MIDKDRKISELVSTQLPEFVRVDNPTLVSFLETYYEWLQNNDRDGKLLSPMSLGDVIDVDNTIDQFIDHFKKEYLFNFPEKLAISDATGKPVDIKRLIKNIKSFYRSKGTEKSYEFLFRILYDVGVEFYYPKKDILRTSDGKWYEKNALKTTTSLGERIYDSVGRIVYQRNAAGKITASAKVVDVNIYQQGIYEVAEITISNRNGNFVANSGASFDVDGETFNEIKIYNVVSSVSITNGGSGYSIGDAVRFTSATGDSGFDASGIVSAISSTGAIRKIRIENFGINYSLAPTVSVESIGGSGFSGTAVLGSLCKSEGYYLNYDGRLSTNKVLQDNHYYQDYSYVLKTEVIIDQYREIIRRLTHPAGMAMFGQVLIKRCAQDDIRNASAMIRYEVPIIGHYAPYTFKTYDNLQDWFTRYEDELYDGLPGSLTAEGYMPFFHNELIQNISIPGNPISSGVPFRIFDSRASYLSVPPFSLPTNTLPSFSIPSQPIYEDRGQFRPLGEPARKYADPFWIIYEHPNRKITEPVLARIWKNQVVGNPEFGWKWDEFCTITGGIGATGWTADFYSAEPVDSKYTFLKYSPTSEFRKITARSFFEMPVGIPFDCRYDFNDISPPSISIASPKNGEVVTADDLVVTISVENGENNRVLPASDKVVEIEVLVDGRPATNIGPKMTLEQRTGRFASPSYGLHRIQINALTENGKKTPLVPSDSIVILYIDTDP
jgi:hypothetical protein